MQMMLINKSCRDCKSSWLSQGNGGGICAGSIQDRTDMTMEKRSGSWDALFSPEPGTTQNLPFCKFKDETHSR
jgi:hypothetical protein